LPWISASSMRGLEYFDSELKITKEGLINGSKLALKGSILLLVRGSMLFNTIPVGIATRDVAFNQDVKSITITTKSTSKFILCWFKASENELLNMVVGTGIGAGKLEFSDLKGMRLFLPTLPEQQKIADFLTAVDDKINRLTRRKTLLEQYKKGVMQKIFAREIRFPGFDGEWEKKKLKEVGDIITGTTPPTSHKDLYGGEYLFVSPIDIKGNRFVNSTKTTVTKKGFNKGRAINKGDVLFVCIGSTIGKIAQAGKECITNQQINSIVTNKLNSPNFLFSLLEKHAKRIKNLSATQAVPILNKFSFSNIKISLPTLPEQQKIADFLTGIDKKIQQVTNQLETTKQWKRGLLQQLFV